MNTYKTSEFGLVAALIAKGYSPRERQVVGKQVFFIFESDELVEELVNDYFNNRLDVDALSYHSALSNVKKSIYELTD